VSARYTIHLTGPQLDVLIAAAALQEETYWDEAASGMPGDAVRLGAVLARARAELHRARDTKRAHW
jgi:hypothetical protein